MYIIMIYMSSDMLTLYFILIYTFAMEKKTGNLLIRLTESEKAAFAQAAELAGIPVSAWIRERLRLAAIRDLEGAGLRVPFVKPISLFGEDDDR